MDVIYGILVLVSVIISIINKVNSTNQKTSSKQRNPDWKRVFKETPTNLEKQKKQETPKETRTVPLSPPLLTQPIIIETKKPSKPSVIPQTIPVMSEVKDFVDWDKEGFEEIKGPLYRQVSEQEVKATSFLDELTRDPEALKKAIIAKEILDKPRALAPWVRR